MEESTASFLDKTDWRITLHRKLEACVDAEGTEYYPKRVKSLISVVSASYPGWDAQRDINDMLKKVRIKYYKLWFDWLEDNSTAKHAKKYHHRKKLYHMEYNEIFEYIKNMCARKRMLLWGSKRIPGGTQIQYRDE